MARFQAPTRERVAAVIVTYHPDPGGLARLCTGLIPSVSDVIVVDNGSGNAVPWTTILPPNARLIRLPRNVGIAAAQNIGVAEARGRSAGQVLFLDQDSAVDAALVDRLIVEQRRLRTAGRPVAAIGPIAHDPRLSRRPPRALRKSRDPIVVDHLISSGSLISLDVLDRVGPLREDLFIDFVDIEWCLRAACLGFDCYQLPDAVMTHRFGTPATVLGLRISMRTPVRHYYLVRNAIWLWRQRWVPLVWKVKRAPALLARLAIYSLVARPALQHWRMMTLGLAHGLANRSGALVL